MSGPFFGVCAKCGTRLTAPNYCAWCNGELLSRIEEDLPMRDRPTKQDDIDHDRYLNALRLLRGIEGRLEGWMEDDVRTARWLMRRIESIDRDAQKRDLE